MTTRIVAIAALLMASAAAASPAAAATFVPGYRGPVEPPVLRDAPLVLPGPVNPMATPRVDSGALSRGLFADDPEAALDALTTVTFSRDGITGETPASEALRAILEALMAGHRID